MKFSPSFRLVLFLLALPFFGFAQQFPVNNQKIVQGVGTTAQGISSYSSSPPTTAPTAATFRHVTSLHMDTVLQVQYIYKRPRWYPISVVRRATPPPATASSGSTTIDYTESIWQSTADSLTYYYEEENACWQPIGTYLSSTTPSDVAATGSTGAICYGYGLWYDPDVDSIYAQQGSTWTAIGAGGGTSGAVDSIVVLQDSIIVGYSEAVEVTRDTIGYPATATGYSDWTAAADSGTPAAIGDGETVTIAGGTGLTSAISGNTITTNLDNTAVTPGTYGSATQVSQNTFDAQGRATGASNVSIQIAQSQVTGLADSLAAAPSGTGTNQRIVVWTGTNSQGNSTQLQSAAGVTLDANLAYRITGGTTASRPTGAAGMMYWNTSNGWLDLHNGTSWFNPARSAYSTGLYTSTRVPFADANGLLTDGTGLTYTSGTGHFFIPSRLNVGGTTPSYAISNYTTSAAAASPWTNNAILLGLTNTGSTPSYTTLAFGTATQATALISARNITATTGELRFYTLGSFADPPDLFISSVGEIGIGTASPDRLLHPELSDAVTNAMSFPLRLTHITSGTAAAGSGAGMEFEAESAGGTNRVAGTIENPFTTATNAAEVSDLVFRTMRAGTLTESLRSLGNGTLQIATYTGTANGIAGKTSAGILTTIPEGHGINLTAGGALEVDTTQMATQSDLAVVAASVAAIPTPVFGKFTGTTDGGGLISITLSATPATGACTCTNNATSGASFRYLFSANWTSGTNVNVRVYDADAFLMLASGAVDFSIICY